MNCLLVMKIKWSLDINTGAVERSEAARARRLTGATVALKMYSIHANKGSHSCLEGVTYALGANDRGVTGAWESFVPLTPGSGPHIAGGSISRLHRSSVRPSVRR